MGTFYLSGSRTSQLEDTDYKSPLAECPDSPNCIRTTIEVREKLDTLFTLSKNILRGMGAETVRTTPGEKQISAVFKVLAFKDDFDLLLQEGDNNLMRVHIRSASRIGYTDLGVNRRRVERFQDALQKAVI